MHRINSSLFLSPLYQSPRAVSFQPLELRPTRHFARSLEVYRFSVPWHSLVSTAFCSLSLRLLSILRSLTVACFGVRYQSPAIATLGSSGKKGRLRGRRLVVLNWYEDLELQYTKFHVPEVRWCVKSTWKNCGGGNNYSGNTRDDRIFKKPWPSPHWFEACCQDKLKLTHAPHDSWRVTNRVGLLLGKNLSYSQRSRVRKLGPDLT